MNTKDGQLVMKGYLPSKIRARMIIKMGNLINCQFGSNLTEPIVYELVLILDPENAILQDSHYKDAR